jgi:hypothetical protein
MHREQMYKSCRRELEKMREDNALLRAEVMAWRVLDDELSCLDPDGVPMRSCAKDYYAAVTVLDAARAALDAAGVMER